MTLRRDTERDWAWSDGHRAAIEAILRKNGWQLLDFKVADADADQNRATDVVVIVEAGNIAIRVRRLEFLLRFKDCTVRSRRDSGAKTELAKLRAGFGDWYLWAWADNPSSICAHILVDLHALRERGLLDMKRPETSNHDGTYFIAIPIQELRARGCVVDEDLGVLQDSA